MRKSFTKKSHSAEDKAKALKYIKDNPELSINQCSKDLGIKNNTLYNWQRNERLSPEINNVEMYAKSPRISSEIKKLINEVKEDRYDAQIAEDANRISSLKFVYYVILELIATLDKLDGYSAPSEMSALENILFVSLGRVTRTLYKCEA